MFKQGLRLVLHVLAAILSIRVFWEFANLEKYSILELIWFTPFGVSNTTMAVMLMASLFNKPKNVESGIFPTLFAFLGTFFPLMIVEYIKHFNLVMMPGNFTMVVAVLYLLVYPFYIYGLFSLNRNLTILPESNKLITNGMYRFVRHPLYACYMTWIMLQSFFYMNFIVFLFSFCQIAFLLFRINYEEKSLLKTFPEYENYRKRVGILFPKKWSKE